MGKLGALLAPRKLWEFAHHLYRGGGCRPLWGEHSISREGEGPLEDGWKMAVGDRVCLGMGPPSRLLSGDKSWSSCSECPGRGPVTPSSCGGPVLRQMWGFRGSTPHTHLLFFMCLWMSTESLTARTQSRFCSLRFGWRLPNCLPEWLYFTSYQQWVKFQPS